MVEWFDSTILDLFQSIQSPVLTPLFKLFTLIGEAGAVWIAVGILLLAGKSSRKAGIAVLLSLIFCLLTGNAFLKNVVFLCTLSHRYSGRSCDWGFSCHGIMVDNR